MFIIEDIRSAPTLNESAYPDIQPITFGSNDVFQHLSNLDVCKAPGPDKIPLQLASQEIVPVLTFIYNTLFYQGEPPTDWKQSYIIPIHKKRNKALASNYRPTSLTSISCKIMEGLIHSHLYSHLKSLNILCDDQQHDFRPCKKIL